MALGSRSPWLSWIVSCFGKPDNSSAWDAQVGERNRNVKILITGNMGYVGPPVAKYLRTARPDATLRGFDNAYFAHCLTGASVFPERDLNEQFYGDVRTIPVEMMRGCDAVVQLAAISNDPMGNQFEAVTLDINQNTTISIAKAAAKAGDRKSVV